MNWVEQTVSGRLGHIKEINLIDIRCSGATLYEMKAFSSLHFSLSVCVRALLLLVVVSYSGGY